MATPPKPGIYVPVPTFFKPGETSSRTPTHPPDLDTQLKHAIHLARAGITGIVIAGTSGEAISLTNAERRAIIAHLRQGLTEAGFADYPLIAGTATQDIGATLTQLREAHEAGAQFALVLAPGNYAATASQAGVAAWFEAVAADSPLPVLVYNFPAITNGLEVQPATMARLAGHRNIVGCKMSHGNISAHARVASNPAIDKAHFTPMTGLGQQLVPFMAVGGRGAIDGLAGFFPRCVVSLFDMQAKGLQSREEIAELQYWVAMGEELIVQYGTPGVKEGVARVLGFGDPDGTRLPMLGRMSDEAWSKFEEAFKELSRREKEFEES